jgi:hypothetical protein
MRVGLHIFLEALGKKPKEVATLTTSTRQEVGATPDALSGHGR